MLREWVNKSWTSHGVRLDAVQNLTKGFFLFRFANPSQAEAIFTNDPWSIRSSLLVFQRWSRDFTVSDDKKLSVPVWVKFLGLPLSCWHFIEAIAQTLGKVVTKEPEKFFNARPQRRICIEVDLSKDLKDSMEIQVGAQTFSQKVLYLNLPNTCYRCQSVEHKIWDCPLFLLG